MAVLHALQGQQRAAVAAWRAVAHHPALPPHFDETPISWYASSAAFAVVVTRAPLP
jgi:hypothetical protein